MADLSLSRDALVNAALKLWLALDHIDEDVFRVALAEFDNRATVHMRDLIADTLADAELSLPFPPRAQPGSPEFEAARRNPRVRQAIDRLMEGGDQ